VASVNRVSLRAEFDGLKGQFEALCARGRISAEGRALIQALLMLFEVLMAVFMERSTPKNSRNASVPPSQTPKDDETASRPGTQSNGREQPLERARHTRTVETVAIAPVTACATCGADLSETPCQGHERRTRIDLVFEKVVSHVDAEIKSCPRCQALTKGRFPADLSGPLQYGTGIKAFVLHLLIAQMVALKRVQQTLATLIEQIVSEATLLKWVLQLHQALAEWERTAIDQLLAEPTLHVDETSLRVERKNHWIHVCSGGDITLKCLHRKRGLEAIRAINIIPPLWGDHRPRLLGLLPVLHPLRPWPVCGPPAARAHLRHRIQRLPVGEESQAPAEEHPCQGGQAREQAADRGRAQAPAQALPRHPGPRRPAVPAPAPAHEGQPRPAGEVRCP
jgi:transposase